MFRNYPDVITVPQLQKMLSIGRNTAYSLLKKDIISSVRIGRVHKIPKSDVIRYLKSVK